MFQQTPIKRIQKRFSISKESSKTIKQQISQQLKIVELQKKLSLRAKKCQENCKQIKELNQKISNLYMIISEKQSEIVKLNQKIRNLTQTITKLQAQSQENQYLKQINSKNIKQLLEQKDCLHENIMGENQLRKVLAKENFQLNAEKSELKKMLAQYDETLLQTRAMLKSEQENSYQLHKINTDLKLQIEEIQFKLKQLQKRVQVDRLYEYENSIDLRAFKQNQENNCHNKEEISKQLVGLLKQRIKNLEQQFIKSQTRCKQLQTIIISK